MTKGASSEMQKITVVSKRAWFQPLALRLAQNDHRTLILWAIDCGERLLPLFAERYPDDPRPAQALAAARAWARGEIKMPIAKKAAHATHNAATAVKSDVVACAAARAMGHVVGTVHVQTHAPGVPLYGLVALANQGEPAEAESIAMHACAWFMEKLIEWENVPGKDELPWASFL